jgi:hypothetical protein
MLKEEDENGETHFRLVTFHEEEIGVLYEPDERFYKGTKQNKLPNIKKIENGD